MGMMLSPKAEGRNPKEIRSPKSETAASLPGAVANVGEVTDSEFGFRPSFGLQISVFGFPHVS
jgi:hypothetical protein